MSTETAAFQPRYSTEESSEAAYEKDQRHRLWMGRKRRAVTALLMVAFLAVVGAFARVYLFFEGMRGARLDGDIQMLSPDDLSRNESSTMYFWSVWKRMNKQGVEFNVAISDSNGFFNAISDIEWEGMKEESRAIIDLQDDIIVQTSHLLTESGANIHSKLWWVDNWKINFSCINKVVFIGGKWICDPKRIISVADENSQPNSWRGRKKRNTNKECLVYISGGMEVEFGHQLLDYSLARMIELHSGEVLEKDSFPCEVHIFSPSSHVQNMHESRDGLFVHSWGFRPSNKESRGMGLAADNTTSIAFKTLEETIAELHHSGRVKLLSIDCEACEWDLYRDLVALDEPIQQVLMQMHGTPYMANELFLAMQEAGYLIFHREEDPGGRGEVYNYSWLKLSASFFNWKPLT